MNNAADVRPPSGTPLVYLIILTWDAKETVLEAVGSVLAMDYPAFRVVVVDNGSRDGTPDAIRKAYAGRVHLIENAENLLYAAGNNVGIKYALEQGADYVALLNNDIVVDKGMLRELVDAAVRAGAGMAGPMMYYYPPRGEGREIIWYAGGVVNYFMGLTRHRGIRQVDRGQYGEARDTGYISGCVLMARADVIRGIGLLDPGYHIYAEDADWCARAKKAGYRLLFAPKARIWHKVSMSSGGTLTPFKAYHRIRGGIRFFRLHARPYHWLTIPPFMAAGALAFIARGLLTGNFRDVKAFVKGMFSP